MRTAFMMDHSVASDQGFSPGRLGIQSASAEVAHDLLFFEEGDLIRILDGRNLLELMTQDRLHLHALPGDAAEEHGHHHMSS